MKHAFDKFINQERNSQKKESIKQEKRKWKDDRKKKFEERNKINDAPGKKYNITGARSGSKNFEVKKRDQYSKFKDAKQEPTINIRQTASEMPLNKFIAHSGVCGRREAAELVKEGKIKVNNAIIYEPGFKVSENDKVVFNGKQ